MFNFLALVGEMKYFEFHDFVTKLHDIFVNEDAANHPQIPKFLRNGTKEEFLELKRYIKKIHEDNAEPTKQKRKQKQKKKTKRGQKKNQKKKHRR